MKSFVPAIAVATACAAGAAPPLVAPELRQALQQYQPRGGQPPPRQLSPGERAELRRQLADSRRPAPRH